jgi:hypothetical protein
MLPLYHSRIARKPHPLAIPAPMYGWPPAGKQGEMTSNLPTGAQCILQRVPLYFKQRK